MELIFSSLSSPGSVLISFGGLNIRWYGLLIALSVLIGIRISVKLARYRNLSQDVINDLLPILILSSLIGARLYYVLFEWRNYSGINFWGSINLLNLKIPIPAFIQIWNGGIAIHGALIMGSISVIIFCIFREENPWDVLDVLIPSVSLGQAIGRWGNFFNNEAFGLPTSLPWKLFIPYTSRPQIFIDESFFHPTFLYESLWNIAIFILLIYIFQLSIKGTAKLPSGAISCIYLITYSLGRIWIEGLRIDPLCLGGIPPFCNGGFRVAQLISSIFISIGIFGLWWLYKKRKNLPNIAKINIKRK